MKRPSLAGFRRPLTFAPELVYEGLASKEEVERIAADLMALADDEATLFGFPLVAQVWATR